MVAFFSAIVLAALVAVLLAGSRSAAETATLVRPAPSPGDRAATGGPTPALADPGALGTLLREYADPGTSRSRRAQIRQAIRRGTRTPAEKSGLKRAVLDRSNRGEIADDLQMALLQSMREHPEASDRAYVLDLLRRRSAPGRLLRSMVRGDDRTYADCLLSAAQAEDVYAIRLLGDLGIAQAASVLERVAVTAKPQSPARAAATASLRRLGTAPGRSERN